MSLAEALVIREPSNRYCPTLLRFTLSDPGSGESETLTSSLESECRCGSWIAGACLAGDGGCMLQWLSPPLASGSLATERTYASVHYRVTLDDGTLLGEFACRRAADYSASGAFTGHNGAPSGGWSRLRTRINNIE